MICREIARICFKSPRDRKAMDKKKAAADADRLASEGKEKEKPSAYAQI